MSSPPSSHPSHPRPKTCWVKPSLVTVTSGGRRSSHRKMQHPDGTPMTTRLFEAESYAGLLSRYRYRIMIQLKKYNNYRVAATNDFEALKNCWNYCTQTIPTLMPAHLNEHEQFQWIETHITFLYYNQDAAGTSDPEGPSYIDLDTSGSSDDDDDDDPDSDDSSFLPSSHRLASSHDTLPSLRSSTPSLHHQLSKSAPIIPRANASEPTINTSTNSLRNRWFRSSFRSPKVDGSKMTKREEEVEKMEKEVPYSSIDTKARKHLNPTVLKYFLEYKAYLKKIFSIDATRDEETIKYLIIFITAFLVDMFIIRHCSFDLFLFLMAIHIYGIRHLIVERRKYIVLLAKRKLNKAVQKEKRKWYNLLSLRQTMPEVVQTVNVTAETTVTAANNEIAVKSEKEVTWTRKVPLLPEDEVR